MTVTGTGSLVSTNSGCHSRYLAEQLEHSTLNIPTALTNLLEASSLQYKHLLGNSSAMSLVYALKTLMSHTYTNNLLGDSQDSGSPCQESVVISIGNGDSMPTNREVRGAEVLICKHYPTGSADHGWKTMLPRKRLATSPLLPPFVSA